MALSQDDKTKLRGILGDRLSLRLETLLNEVDEGTLSTTTLSISGSATIGDTLTVSAAIQGTALTLTAANLIMQGTTGNNNFALDENLADALSIHDGVADLMVFTTTTGARAIKAGNGTSDRVVARAVTRLAAGEFTSKALMALGDVEAAEAAGLTASGGFGLGFDCGGTSEGAPGINSSANNDVLAWLAFGGGDLHGNHNVTTIAGIYVPEFHGYSNVGARTCTNWAVIYIGGTFQVTDLTITNGPYAIFIDDGNCRFDGDVINYGDATTNKTTSVTTTSITEAIVCATGEYETRLTDNRADAWSIKVTSGNDLLVFQTTDSAEAVLIANNLASTPPANQTLTNGATITLPTGCVKVVDNGGAVTGIILAAGVVDGQILHLVNAAAATATFDATPATSRVAIAVSVLGANAAWTLVWDSGTSLWYRTS